MFTSATGAGNFDGDKGNWHWLTRAYSTAAGVTGWTRHDLRRTAATLDGRASRVGITSIEMILNHSEGAGKGGAIAAIYNRHGYELEKREALTSWRGGCASWPKVAPARSSTFARNAKRRVP